MGCKSGRDKCGHGEVNYLDRLTGEAAGKRKTRTARLADGSFVDAHPTGVVPVQKRAGGLLPAPP